MNSEKPWQKAYYILISIILLALIQPSGGTWAWLHNVRWLYVLILSFTLSYFLTPMVIKLAFFFKILDYPDSRKLHKAPTPRIGGLAIFVAFIVSAARNFQFSQEFLGLMVGSSMIYIIGLIDDIRPLPASTRLVWQLIACLIVILNGIIITVIPKYVPGHYFLSVLITIVWLLGLANALNFLDGIDGLATGLCILGSTLFFLIAWPTRQSYLSYITIALAGSCLGFLPFNWKTAKVFLGDSGATFLGFTLASLAVMGSWAHDNPMVAISTPLLILGIPIFDTIYITISRIHKGYVKTFKQWLDYVGRDHFHHRLLRVGFSDIQTVLFILFLNISLGLGALVIRDTGTKGSLLLLLQAIIIFLIIVALMVVGKESNFDRRADDKKIDIV